MQRKYKISGWRVLFEMLQEKALLFWNISRGRSAFLCLYKLTGFHPSIWIPRFYWENPAFEIYSKTMQTFYFDEENLRMDLENGGSIFKM